MSFVSDWATEDYRTLLSMPEQILRVFKTHVQQQDGSEAGGLLLGTVHGANMALVEATVPTRWDKRFQYLFERMPFGHRAIAEKRWRLSGGTVRYLGEWHTHPQDYPSPSSIDRTEWISLARNRLDGRPLLVVIVGRKGLYVEMVPSAGRGSVLSPLS